MNTHKVSESGMEDLLLQTHKRFLNLFCETIVHVWVFQQIVQKRLCATSGSLLVSHFQNSKF